MPPAAACCEDDARPPTMHFTKADSATGKYGTAGVSREEPWQAVNCSSGSRQEPKLRIDVDNESNWARCCGGHRNNNNSSLHAALKDVLRAEMPKIVSQALHGELKKLLGEVISEQAVKERCGAIPEKPGTQGGGDLLQTGALPPVPSEASLAGFAVCSSTDGFKKPRNSEGRLESLLVEMQRVLLSRSSVQEAKLADVHSMLKVLQEDSQEAEGFDQANFSDGMSHASEASKPANGGNPPSVKGDQNEAEHLLNTESKPKPEKAEVVKIASGRHAAPDSSQPQVGKGRRSMVFVDADKLKADMRMQVLQRETEGPFILYHDRGFWQFIAKHHWFETITLAVISINAIWMAIDTDYNKSDSLWEAELPFIIGENFFCVYFSAELIIRFFAFKKKLWIFHDAWFMFDWLIVTLMIMETWALPGLVSVVSLGPAEAIFSNTAILRLFRLMRLCRMIRMLRGLPELMLLCKGMVAAMRSVFYVMVLLIVVTYVYGIALVQLSEGTEFGEAYFPDVSLAMYSLIIYGVFLDNLADFCDAVRVESLTILCILCSFVIVACMTVLNMLVGVLCEVVSAVAATEKEEVMTQNLCRDMKAIITSLPERESFDYIGQDDLLTILQQPEAIKTLHNACIDPTSLLEFSALFFSPDGVSIELPFSEFMELLLDMRGSNAATVRDVMNLWKRINPRILSTSAGVKELLKRSLKSPFKTSSGIGL
eukprot:TRINITY_DN6257_c0_g1_i1.p1 TRINITY_DN6257_c0_g1~~TRINITY_DN6257_c0_g1_i1.p1  ORF type:complete len:712 (+),score=173.95 TRINITY_DN6257_c0_g1_i1:111-2246(+)